MTPDPRGMRWVIDEGIPITPALNQLMGKVEVLPGRDITAEAIADAQIVLVRSITKVDRTLLQDSSVRFVGSATAGTDHIDAPALAELGIPWSAAPGSNAIAVVEYVLSAMALSGFLAPAMRGLGVGIVGLGAVGSQLATRLLALGCSVIAHDPLRQRWPDNIQRVTLNEALSQPIVSLHANLHDQSPFPSTGLLGTAVAEFMAQGAENRGMGLLINAARGELITTDALMLLLASPLTVILDTWPGEPRLPESVLAAADWISPHIAGHSQDAKTRGSDCLASALERWAGGGLLNGTDENLQDIVFEEASIGGRVMAADATDWATLFLKNRGTLAREDARIRALGSGGLTAQDFDALRKTYRQPSEWSGGTIRLSSQDPALSEMAARLGMNVAT